MRTMNQMLRDEKGQGIMEYVLIAIVIGLIVLFTAARFGSSIRDRFTKAGETVDSTKITDTDTAADELSAE
jgi:Flp pilus assembly pilin Flp